MKTNSSDINDGLRKKVILFLTDGKPTDKVNITAVLEKEKHSLKLATSKDVVIFAYGIGSHDFSLLREIAQDTEAEGTKVKINVNLFVDNMLSVQTTPCTTNDIMYSCTPCYLSLEINFFSGSIHRSNTQ